MRVLVSVVPAGRASAPISYRGGTSSCSGSCSARMAERVRAQPIAASHIPPHRIPVKVDRSSWCSLWV